MDIKNIRLFQGLPPVALEALKSCLIEKSFRKGEIIHHEGGGCGLLFFVQTGRIKMYRMSPSGKEQIFEILEPGDTCACNPGTTAWFCTATAEAIVPSRIWLLSRAYYARMLRENITLSNAMNEHMAKRLRCFSDIAADIALKDTKKRLAKFLLTAIEKKQSESQANPLTLNFTREEIGRRLGTARETIARQLSDLKRKKVIDTKASKIIILDQKALERMLQ